MKFLRLVTEDKNANFNNDFSSDIKVKENSQIALHSVSFEPIQNVLIIDATNHTITYNLTNTTPGNAKTITLNTAEYTNLNFQDFLDDFTLKLNNSLDLAGKQIGTQFLIFIGESTKKAEITTRFSPMKNQHFFLNNGLSLGAGANGFIRKDDNTHTNNDLRKLILQHPFIQGCGVFRVKIKNLTDHGGASNQNGFTIGLSENDIPLTTQNINKAYAIRVRKPTDNYITIKDNVETIHAFAPHSHLTAGGNNNDVLEISVSLGKIRMRVYRNNQAAADTLFEEDYDRNREYYPFISFQGGANHAEAFQLRYNYDPYKFDLALPNNTQPTENSNNIHSQDDHSGFTARPPNPARNINNQFRITLTEPISRFLEYDQEELIQQGVEHTILANRLFKATLVNDSFLIEMKNIELESYDGIDSNGMRKNLLAIVPKSDSSGIVEYEPNNPYFIDMNNREMTLRNIQARILRSDLEKVSVGGLTILTILIKGPNE